MKYLKPFKRDLIKYYYFINIFIFYWNRSFVLVNFLFFDFNITFSISISQYPFVSTIFLIYNFPLFFQSIFGNNFIALLFLIPVIMQQKSAFLKFKIAILYDSITSFQVIAESSIMLVKYFPISQLYVAGFKI